MVYDYIRYYTTILGLEKRSLNNAFVSDDSFNPNECRMCCSEIKPNETQCSVCLEYVPDHQNAANNKRKQKDKTEDNIDSKRTKIKDNETVNIRPVMTRHNSVQDRNGQHNNDEVKEHIHANKDKYHSMHNSKTFPEKMTIYDAGIAARDNSIQYGNTRHHDEIANGNEMTNSSTNHSMNCNKTFHDILMSHSDKWICQDCTVLHMYSLMNCELCGANRQEKGLWMCETCSLINEIKANECTACEDANQYMPKHSHTTNSAHLDNQNKRKTFSNGTSINSKKGSGKSIKQKPTNANGVKDKFANAGKGKGNTIADNSDPDWICWDEACKHVNDSTFQYCHECKLQRAQPDQSNDLVKCESKEGIKTVWICDKCKKRNKEHDFKCGGGNCGRYRFYEAVDLKHLKTKVNDCKDIPENKIFGEIISDQGSEIDANHAKLDKSTWSCNKCTFINKRSNKKCEICDSKMIVENSKISNEMEEQPGKWKCWHKNCTIFNDDEIKFCKHCKLYRFASQNPGDMVEYSDANKVKQIWICHGCSKFNELTNKKCAGKKCNKNRFPPVQ